MFENCIRCGTELPLLNGVEENDFSYFCDDCKHEQTELKEEIEE